MQISYFLLKSWLNDRKGNEVLIMSDFRAVVSCRLKGEPGGRVYM